MNKIILTLAISTSNTETLALTYSFVSYLNAQCCTSSIRQDVRGFLWSCLVWWQWSTTHCRIRKLFRIFLLQTSGMGHYIPCSRK